MNKMVPMVIKNEDLGYDDFFESNFNKLKLDNCLVARVTTESRGSYKVKNEDGEYLAKITGKQMFNALSREDYPAVGDWVVIRKADKENVVIEKVLARRSIIKRKSNSKNEVQVIATNIDTAFVIESVGRDYNLNRFERYIAIANAGNVKPVIILNKIDLISKKELDLVQNQIKERFCGVDLIFTSTLTNEGLDELKKYIVSGKTYCFLGSSGVGKSSLINKLIGESIIKTDDISTYAGRGKHATTNRQMYFLENGGIVIDNPGIREVGMTDSIAGINDVFNEMLVLAKKCKYANCTHIHEPGCEVIMSLKSGKLDEEKYSNYINLKKEAEYYEVNKFERREKERKFGKFIKTAKKEIKKYKF
ncbi:MAG: ribosome small subunit-dependent GTPase A [Minisyncoccota bacterium]